jgi:peroxiredoxin
MRGTHSLSQRLWASIGAAVLAFALCAHAHAENGQDYANQAGARLIGQTVPPLRLTTIDGKSIDLDALRGRKAVYLKFWATWCSPCREQMPHFENVQRNAGKDLQVVAINLGFDDMVEQIKAYRDELGLTMPIVRDDDGHLGAVFGLRVTPQHVIIGKDGRIAYVGHLADAKLDQALASARAAKPSTLGAVAMHGKDSGETTPSPLKTLEGDAVTLTDPTGKHRTVLAFMSPWCEGYFEKTRPESSRQCRVLREQLVALGRDSLGPDSSVHWIGIASGLWASEADLREYRDEHHIPVPLALDRDDALFRRFGVRRVPAVIVLDADGRILQHIDVGTLGKQGLSELVPTHAGVSPAAGSR